MNVARALGYRFFERNSSRSWALRFSWAEISGGLGLALALINWGEDSGWSLHIHLGWPNILLKLPFLPRREVIDDCMNEWGFSVDTDSWASIHLNWGAKTKFIHMPWQWDFVRRSILAPNGRSWVHELRGFDLRHDQVPIGLPEEGNRYWSLRECVRWSRTLPYRYVLRSGQIQERKATIGVEEMEWRWRWFKWLPWPRLIKRSIDVSFDDEVGEHSGSWKGGTVGCSYALRSDETPEECLRRMERDRKF